MLELESFYPEIPGIVQSLRNQLRSAGADKALEICDQLIAAYRAGAVGALLVDASDRSYDQALAQSGSVRVHMLGIEKPSPTASGRFRKATRSRGLFDAVAAGRLDIARQIVERSERAWRPQFEYEEDFLYVEFVHRWVESSLEERAATLLCRWSEVLDGSTDIRYQVCQALRERDQQAFQDAFDGLIRLRSDELLAAQRSLSRNELEFLGDRYVYFEGLALLTMAEQRGLETESEYRYCPAEARRRVRD